MTGFGVDRLRTEEIEFEVSVKTVNGRFLEARYHTPKEFAAFESDFKKLIAKYIRRGSVDIYIYRKYLAKGQKTVVSANKDLALKWIKSYKALAKDLKLSTDKPTMQEILSHSPEILSLNEVPKFSGSVKKSILEGLEKALILCDKERVREGKALKVELLKLYTELEVLVSEMDQEKIEAAKKLEEKFKLRLEKLGLKETIDPQRFAQEVVIQVDKLDVFEEITRLTEHLRTCKKQVGKNKIQGKKLDFYSQELLREVNTIGSKSQIAKLTTTVVNAKSIIERVREQVQNVE